MGEGRETKQETSSQSKGKEDRRIIRTKQVEKKKAEERTTLSSFALTSHRNKFMRNREFCQQGITTISLLSIRFHCFGCVSLLKWPLLRSMTTTMGKTKNKNNQKTSRIVKELVSKGFIDSFSLLSLPSWFPFLYRFFLLVAVT